MKERYLLLETSGRVGQIGLAEGDRVLVQRRLDETRRHARDLAPQLQSMLRELDWRPADIAAVFVSQGPGSYTGLRVGIMSAKAFAYAAGCRILGISTLAAIALQSGVRRVEVISDAQQDRLYHQTFEVDVALRLPSAVSPLAILPASEWLAQLAAGAVVSGPGIDIVVSRLPSGVAVVPPDLRAARIESLLRVGLDRLSRDEADNVFSLEPLYLRPSSAEEKWVTLGR
jgi:tRNA threonylcarbamoyladenosine biosynthesis protein TsaB